MVDTKRCILLLMSILLVACAGPRAPAETSPAGQQQQAPAPPAYRLDVGDKIRIDVFGEPDLSIETTLDEGGSISYPFLGRVALAGMTTREVEQHIADNLRGDYLVNPVVRVNVLQFRPIYVMGAVRRSGAYPYSTGLTVEQATALAGGLTEFASRRRIYLIRDTGDDKARYRAEMNTPVAPGDTIVVEEGLF